MLLPAMNCKSAREECNVPARVMIISSSGNKIKCCQASRTPGSMVIMISMESVTTGDHW